MSQTIFPIPSAETPDVVTPPVGFRKSVFDGHFTSGTPTKYGSFTPNIYRVESAAANGSSFIFNNGATSFVCSAGTPVNFALASTSSSFSVTKPADGGSWTARSLSQDGYWTAVAYGNGTYVAFSSWGQVCTSPDGATWTTRGNIGSMYAATFAEGTFVAVGSGQNAYTSTDGITWTARNMGWNTSFIGIAYGGGRFVAVVQNNSQFIYSGNSGVSWTMVSTGLYADWRAIAYGNGRFVAIAYGNSNFVSSVDGSSWTSYSTLPASSAWNSIAWNGTAFVALSTGTSTNAYSTTGTAWQSMSLPAHGYNNFLKVTANAGVFVAVVGYSNVALTSMNGTTWTQRTLPQSAQWAEGTIGGGIVGSGSGFVAVAYNYARIAASSTGSSDTGRIAFSVFPASSTNY